MAEQTLVRDKMSPPTETIHATSTLVAARQRMQSEMRVKSLIVIEGDRPVGILRYTDINRASGAQGTIADLMVTDVPPAREDQPLEELSGVMTEYDIDRLPVVDASGALIGELPRAALTLAETTGVEAISGQTTLSDAQSDQATPAFDVKKDMSVVGAQGHKVGKVKEVMADALSGSLTHVVVHTGILFGKDKSVPVDLVDRVEGGDVYLKVDKSEIDVLPDLNAAE